MPRREPLPFMYALGRAGLPATVRVGPATYRLDRLIKHDFWAGTGFYAREAAGGDATLPGRIVVKINRREPLLGVPMRWTGRWLYRRERRAYASLQHLPNVPRLLDGDGTDTGLIHAYVEGAPLSKHRPVPDAFFGELLDVIGKLRDSGIAYVDTNKASNVLQGEDGRPYLFDFQISFDARRWWPRWLGRWLLERFYRADVYHVLKLKRRFRPDQLTPGDLELLARGRPGQGLHRAMVAPYFAVRRPVMRWMRRRGWIGEELST